jgi:hypothetical protein
VVAFSNVNFPIPEFRPLLSSASQHWIPAAKSPSKIAKEERQETDVLQLGSCQEGCSKSDWIKRQASCTGSKGVEA